MKFLKKTAALLFCVALALSVMAISAMAAEDTYTVCLKYSEAKLGSTSVTLNDYDKDNYLEISLPNDSADLPSEVDEITFDIMMGTSLTGDAAKVNTFAFKIADIAGLTYKSGWMGASSTDGDTFMTPANGSNTQNSAGYYTFTAGSSTKLAVPGTLDTPLKVGEITFTIANTLATNSEIAPQLTDAEIKPQAGTAMYVPNTDGTIGMISVKDNDNKETETQGIKANPQYTLTFQYKQNNSTTNIIEDKTGTGATETATYYYSTGLAKNDLPVWVDINAYRAGDNDANNGTYTAEWEVRTLDTTVDNNNDGWTVAEQFDVNGTNDVIISAGRVGAVTLEAVHTAIEYTATFVLDEAKATTGYHGTFKALSGETVSYAEKCAAYANENGNGYTHTYTVEDLYDNAAQSPAATAYLGIGTAPTRNGYTFVKWTAAKTDSNDADFNSGWLTATYAKGEVPNTTTVQNQNEVDSVVGLYGNVTFTAVWKVFGYNENVTYQYAGSDSALVLFAVPQANVINGVYNVTPASGSAAAMYDVLPARYKSAFSTSYAALDTANDKVFAYIVELVDDDNNPETAKVAPELTFTVTENGENESAKNTEILYNGNVFKGDSSTTINAADYGNVNSLLVNTDQFAIQDFGVQARLEADMVTGGTKFGDISDVYAIIKLAGTTPAATRSAT